MGRTAKISIIPVTFTVLPVIFYALPPPAALFFSHSLPPPSSNCPARTDISIAQKTCVFRPVDISVAAKHSKLIYQSVYSLLGTELPQSKPDGFASSLWEGAFGSTAKFPVLPKAPSPRGLSSAARLGEFLPTCAFSGSSAVVTRHLPALPRCCFAPAAPAR